QEARKMEPLDSESHMDRQESSSSFTQIPRRPKLIILEEIHTETDGNELDTSYHQSIAALAAEIARRKQNEQYLTERVAALTETVAQLDSFCHTVSHDLRTPLRSMQNHARALLADHSPQMASTAVESLIRIDRAAGRLNVLVRDLLEYSKASKAEI